MFKNLANKIYIIVVIIFLISNCYAQNPLPDQFKITSISNDQINIRAIAVDGNQLWYAGDSGRFGKIDLGSGKKTEKTIYKDSLKIEFRSIAVTKEFVFILSIGTPALLYKISKADLSYDLVYVENNEKTFYDSMQFRDNRFGMAVGDPIEDCLSFIITEDFGQTWNKISCQSLPKVVEGEGAFASSNTNLVIRDENVWIVSGGKKARVFYSNDFARTWNISETPIIQGETMTGIFTADFYNSKIGIIAGGDYEKQEQNFGNKAITTDGGKNWKIIAENKAFGYASCIQFFPESEGQKILCAAGNGIFYSQDQGESWEKISDERDIYTIRFKNKKTAFLAGRNKILKISLQVK